MGVKANAVKMCTIVFGWCEEVETSAESFTLFQTRLNTFIEYNLQATFKVRIDVYKLCSRFA